MNEELRALLREAYNRGASREQLDVIVERYRASKKKEESIPSTSLDGELPSPEIDYGPTSFAQESGVTSEDVKKTEEGLGNLLKVWKIVNYDNDLIKTIRILSYFIKYKNSVWFRSLFWVLKKPTRFFLRIGFSNLHLFDFYKLGFLIELNAKIE